MKHGINVHKHVWAGVVTLALVAGSVAGCKTQQSAPRTDQQIATDVQAKIHNESALAGQNIQVSVANGVATLSGNVSDAASRALAGNDSGTVAGVKTVVNNLVVQSEQPTAAAVAPPSAQEASVPARHEQERRADKKARRERAQEQVAPPPSQVAQAPAPPTPAPALPPAPPKPVVKEVILAAGTVLPIRITETLDSKTAQPNDVFHGSLAGDLGTQGVIALPQGSPVLGRIVDAKDAAHFKGSALLTLELTQVTARGQKITLVTESYSKEGAARGKNTATKAGGGAALGAIIGALAGGGKGAAIGGLAGAGAGVGVNAATRGQQVTIPTETLINFRLQSPITLTVTIPPRGDQSQGNEPQLQHR